ncbi:hypothetical protein HK414_18550 [Ramlibacter terrae]|uniref:Uncharacterized protein n=1 Tax=Ramlibacter terrae TaxID=2732511 RepID=A0ABX6NZH7_9BURK|nr:hypothetical protein HK414_18550 [Ramlibacter terrae]
MQHLRAQHVAGLEHRFDVVGIDRPLALAQQVQQVFLQVRQSAISGQPSIAALPLIECTARKIAFRSSGCGASMSMCSRIDSTFARCSCASSKKIVRKASGSPKALEGWNMVRPAAR